MVAIYLLMLDGEHPVTKMAIRPVSMGVWWDSAIQGAIGKQFR